MKFNKLIPEISVSSLEKSLIFYKKILGFKIEYIRPETKFTFVSYEGSQLMIDEVNPKQTKGTWVLGKLEYPFGRGINFQIEVKNLNKILKSIQKHNYPLFVNPTEHWYRKGKKLLGSREFLVTDPDGYVLRFAQDIGEKPISKTKS